MQINKNLLEVSTHLQDGYKPLIDYENWRVAILNFSEELRPQNITSLQRHNETDEVFVLLSGRCILFLGEGDQEVTAIHGQDMMPRTLYNIKKKVWHSHTLSEDAMVLIVENRDTTFDNSPFCSLDKEQRNLLVTLTHQLWKI